MIADPATAKSLSHVIPPSVLNWNDRSWRDHKPQNSLLPRARATTARSPAKADATSRPVLQSAHHNLLGARQQRLDLGATWRAGAAAEPRAFEPGRGDADGSRRSNGRLPKTYLGLTRAV